MVIRKLTKNADPDKCSIGFDSRSEFLHMQVWEQMSLFLKLMLAHLGMLIIKIKISWLLVKDQQND